MAIDAGGGTVGSQQHKTRLRVVETRKLFPRFRGMAGLASRGGSIGTHLLHALFELAFMGIGMTTGAIEIAPVIHGGRFRLKLRRLFMAFGAGHGNVSARQREAGLLVLG